MPNNPNFPNNSNLDKTYYLNKLSSDYTLLLKDSATINNHNQELIKKLNNKQTEIEELKNHISVLKKDLRLYVSYNNEKDEKILTLKQKLEFINRHCLCSHGSVVKRESLDREQRKHKRCQEMFKDLNEKYNVLSKEHDTLKKKKTTIKDVLIRLITFLIFNSVDFDKATKVVLNKELQEIIKLLSEK